MRTLPFFSVLLLVSVAIAAPVVAQNAPVDPRDSTYPAPWGGAPGAGATGGGFSFGDAVWSPDVDATTTTDRWDTTLTLEQQGLDTSERRAEDIILEGENAGAFEIRENTCVGEMAPGQSCGVRVGLREGVADGTYTVNVRDAVSGRSVRVKVRLERPRDVELVISGTVFNYDVAAEALAAGWQPGMGINLRILPGARVGSTAPSAPAMRIGPFEGLPRPVNVINEGRIQGAGGQGGQGAQSDGTQINGIWWMRGQNGGPAIRAEAPTVMQNLGQIWGGGGGGGSGHCRMLYHAAGSGGGGAGLVGGRGGPQTGERVPSQGPGQPGSTEAGGMGSCSQFITGYTCPSGGVLETTQWEWGEGDTPRCVITIRPPSGADPGEFRYYRATPTYDRCGGRGGDPGEPGQPGFGSGRWCGGNEPGQAGASVEGSSWISWQVFGDVRGPLR
jgi:hypothetical protein